MKQETLYDVLKVSEDAPPEIIKAAFRAMSSMRHPDKSPTDASAATAAMQAINQAYTTLRDPTLRARYDAELHLKRMQQQAKAHTPPPAAPAPSSQTSSKRTARNARSSPQANPETSRRPLIPTPIKQATQQLTGLLLVSCTNPLIYVGGGLLSWALTFAGPLLGATCLYGLFAIFTPRLAQQGWPKRFFWIAWLLLALALSKAWIDWKHNMAEHAPQLERLERLLLR